MDEARTTGLDDPALADATLAPAGAALPEAERPSDGEGPQPPASWCAHALVGPARAAAGRGVLYVASSERRSDEVGRALRQFAPDLEVLVLPPWDCLPYDRASPSRECMGRRMAVLARLSEAPGGPRVLVGSVEAFMQRTPPARALKAAFLTLRVGEALDRAALQAFAASTGYLTDDRIDEPGEIAVLGSVVDIYPAAASAPVRITLGAGDRIQEIKRYDPLTQRTAEALDEVVVGPASELILDADDSADAREGGAEHRAPEVYGRMRSVLEALPDALVAMDPKALRRAADFAEQVAEAHEARRLLNDTDGERLLAPESLYVELGAYRRALARLTPVELDAASVDAVPRFALERNPGRAFADHVGSRLEQGRRVVLSGLAHELRALVRAVKRGLDRTPETAADWDEALAAAPGTLLALEADLEGGFEDTGAGLVVVAASDVLGGRVATRTSTDASAAILADPDLRVGDVVIHEDHGLGVLRALEMVDVDGAPRDALRIEYHGGATLLAPIEDLGRIWRYGAEAEAVTLERLHSDAWNKRRAALSADIEQTAARLVELARARAELKGCVLEPPKAAYARFAARFPYPETPDQAAAIAAVLSDLASGRVMNRLVCGDVGFGKTEVALRAAAAAALSGKQVAVAAPTTVLARQHSKVFRRRFAGTGVAVARLSRLATAAEARTVKAGLADGSIGVLVGTHALAAKDVSFANLGLLIIDEEQRFGAQLKSRLRDLARDAHLLTMTATPIPRTLQLAMVGIEDVSVIATPPARRRPIRTFLAPWDAATVRTALLRERRRGGQSFVVVPRIADIEPLTEALARLAPELTTRVAHGELPADRVDEVMVDFAAGGGDVLLATNIIESGLDVPRANTMLVWRADLFGLAQLHQLRGRVGRGRTQGVAYLLHDPAVEMPEATRARLSTLEAFDRLGSGLAISARDLELRGSGDLVGDDQAGHVKLIGTALYQKLLTRAVRAAKGEIAGPDWTPELNLGLTGAFPESYVPDATIRINLYARLARLETPEEVDAFAEELEDRFGAPPEEAAGLLDLARLQARARRAGVLRVDAGPKAIALTCAGPLPATPPAGLEAKDGRLILRRAATRGGPRTREVQSLLEALAEAE
jgi:transcription-repair coupling factor (superfamily II helicase)